MIQSISWDNWDEHAIKNTTKSISFCQFFLQLVKKLNNLKETTCVEGCTSKWYKASLETIETSAQSISETFLSFSSASFHQNNISNRPLRTATEQKAKKPRIAKAPTFSLQKILERKRFERIFQLEDWAFCCFPSFFCYFPKRSLDNLWERIGCMLGASSVAATKWNITK